MDISVFTLVFKNRSIEDTIKIAKEIGYDGIELWGAEPHISSDTPINKVKQIKELTDKYELTLPSIGSYIGDFSTLSDDECKQEVEKLEKFFNIMNILKCDLIRVNPGGPNAFLAQEYHYEKGLYWMNICANLAAQYNVRIAMEIHNGSLIETVEAASDFLKRLNKENVGIILDAGNMYISGTDYGTRAVEILSEKVFHVHVKDELRVKDDTLPDTFHDKTIYGDEIFQQKLLGEGAVDHLPLFKALIKSNYNGFLSSECHVNMPDIEKAKHELAKIRELLNMAKVNI